MSDSHPNPNQDSLPVTIYDTTLRDGAQAEGIHFSLSDKLRVAQRLDEFGVHYIEGGWPGSNEKDFEFFQKAQGLNFRHARLAAFGSTRSPNSQAKVDAQVAALLRAETPVVTLVCKSSELHVTEILRTGLDENLAMIDDTISFLKNHGKEVIFDAEHFFDGFKANAGYTKKCCQVAAEAGAAYVVLCDTNGGSMVEEVYKITQEMVGFLPKSARVGIHTHDDSGLGVANALAAVRAGASQVQGTINGFGERVGNCNLVTVVACLQLKMGRPVVTEKNLARLRDLSVFVDEVANQRPNPRAPFVGNTAFAHKGGIHVNAINKLSKSYEHIQPELVGNSQRVLVGELAGRSNVVLKARQLGLDLSEKNPAAREVLDQVKKLEALGFEFESADASFEILTKKVLKQYKPFFELLDYHVSIRKNNAPPFQYDKCEAILKLKTGEKTDHTADEGDGPVNALDKALRKALVPHFPQLANMRLVDYKVRIVDSTAGTGASTRVLIESTDGVSNWTTVGVSVDIIEASWIALRDSVEYLLSKTTT